MALTITEALAEIKTIQKRIEKKREFVGQYIARQERLKDPLEHEGGSRQALERERQAIADLEERIVSIRAAIQQKNQETTISVGGETRSIADWLVWRREVAPGRQQFVSRLRGALQGIRAEASKKGLAVRGDEAAATSLDDITVNVNEKRLAEEAERLEEILGALDGQLSLKNATVVVAV
jgi:hypothetical protein